MTIKAIVFDVDGVLTDGGVWWGPNGEEWKRFSFVDIMGVSLAIKAGLRIGLISGEDSPLVDRLARKFGITDVVKGCNDKAAALLQFAGHHGLSLEQIAFMGDDVNDLGAIGLAGLSVAPASAVPAVLQQVAVVTTHTGGNGAVRELIDAVLGDAHQSSKAAVTERR